MPMFEQYVSKLQAPDVIIHLGAGLCQELDCWRASGAKRIILVEPNPELLCELQSRVGATEPIEIVSSAVSDQAGCQPLVLYNFPLASSLRTPVNLKTLPGLKQIGSTLVEAKSIDELLSTLQLSEDGEHWLVIDTPGEEASILEGLDQKGYLYWFKRIFLTAGLEAFHEGASSASVLNQYLQEQGFRVDGLDDTSDRDWPRYFFVLDPVALKNRELLRELNETQRLHQEEQSARLLEHAEQEALTNQLQLETASVQRKLEITLEKLQKHKADLSIALRLQTMRENDLRELQERYGQLSEINREQRELLGKLHQRLTLAAKYLALAENSDQPADMIRKDLARVLSAKQYEPD